VGNVMYARYHKSDVDEPLTRVEIRQKTGHHTVALLDYDLSGPTKYIFPQPDTPVTLDWGYLPKGLTKFYGYVNHYETMTNDALRTTTRVVVIGTSKPMNSTRPDNLWRDTTRSAIARHIAKRNRFRSIIHPHHEKVESWAGGPRSDIQCLRALAKEIGYKVWIDGPTLHFLDPRRVLASPASDDYPQFVMGEDLLSVKAFAGEHTPGTNSGYQRVVFGLDNKTNEIFKKTAGKPNHPRRLETEVARNYGELQHLTESFDKMDMEAYTVQMTLDGEPQVHPTGLVSLIGDNLTNDQAGTWLIDEATHVLTDQGFTTYATGVRDKEDDLGIRTWNSIRGAVKKKPAVIRDGTNWEATLQEHVNV
jgi:phage protein D